MKNSKKKIIVSLMGLTMGAALVGSVSGSVAWYQYSTRATATIEGVSAGSSRNLQVRIKGDADNKWRNNITVDELNAAFGVTAAGASKLALRPATIHTATGANNEALPVTSSNPDFKKQPESRREPFALVGDNKTEGTGTGTSFYYVQTTLQFKVVDNGSTTANATKNIYLTDAIVDGDEKIENSLRLHISDGDSKNFLIANSATTTDVSGALDINGNNKVDTNDWAEDDSAGKPYHYCNESHMNDEDYDSAGEPPVYTIKNSSILKQASYSLAAGEGTGANQILANDDNQRTITGNPLGKTLAATDSFLELTLTLWLEGWDKTVDLQANSASTAIWDPEKTITQNFSLQLRFSCNTAEGND